MKFIRTVAALVALAFACVAPAAAQWQTLNHSVPVGQGAGVTGFRSASPGTLGWALTSNGPTLDPTFQPIPSFMTIGEVINSGVANALLYNNGGVLGNIITSATGAYNQFQNLTGGQWVGVPVNAFGAINDGITNNTAALVSAATYANTNKLGLLLSSGSNYRTTPIQFGGPATPNTGTFAGSISGTTLTVPTTPTVQLVPGQTLTCTGCVADTVITAFNGNASGWVGTYTVNNSTTATGTVTITATAPSFTAFIVGTTMTVTAVANGRLLPVASLSGGTIIPGTTIVSQLTGAAGLTGTYTVAYSQTVTSTAGLRAYPYTVAPIPNFIEGAPGGETQTILVALAGSASPHALVKIVDPPALGALLGFQISNLRLNALSLYGNSIMLHGFANTTSGGQAWIHNVTAAGATGSTCGFNFVGNAPAGSWGVIEARASQLSGTGNTVCDFNLDGNNGDGSHNIQAFLMERASANSFGSGPGFRSNFADVTCVDCLSQNHLGPPIAFDNVYHAVWINFYSEADAVAITSTANTAGVHITGTLTNGVGSGLLTCKTCEIDVHTGGGLGTFPTNTQRNAGSIFPTDITLGSILGSTQCVQANSLGVLSGTGGACGGGGSSALTNTHIFVGNASNIAADVAMSGDAAIANTGAVTFPSINAGVGTFGSTTSCITVTANAKGQITALSAATCAPNIANVAGLGTGVGTWLTTPTSANLAAALTDETGTGAAVFGNSPTITTPNVVGTTAGGNAATGSVGEYLSVNSIGSPVTLTTLTPTNVTSLAITAGDWDCGGVAGYTAGATTNLLFSLATISTTTGTVGAAGTNRYQEVYGSSGTVPGNSNNLEHPLPIVRISVSGATTVFLVDNVSFTVSTLQAYGSLWCRRIR